MIRLMSCVVAALLLSACASGGGAQREFDWLGAWFTGEHTQEPTPHLDARYSYLRVHQDAQPSAYLVLGYLDGQGSQAIQTWYSAQREVLQVQQGRIIAAHGLPVAWHHVTWSPTLPDWPEVASVRSYRRQLDVDQSAYARVDDLVLRAVSWVDVPDQVRSGIKSDDTSPEPGPQWRWFVEQPKTDDGELSAPLTTWLALGQDGNWAFTRQCLRADYCLNLQPWP